MDKAGSDTADRASARRTDYARLVAPDAYVKGRKLPRETMDQWKAAIVDAAPARPVRAVLDLGCGTGRFTGMLAGCLRATALGVDPSPSMLIRARVGARGRVKFRRGRAERIPVGDGQVDLVFMSQTWHHLADEERAAAELWRVLAPGGRVCIRNSTIEDLGSYLYMRFFPRARRTFLRRMPRRRRIVSVMRRAGFRMVRLRVVRQAFAPVLPTYLDRIGRRALSDLAALSKPEFSGGLDRLARYCRGRHRDAPVIERIDLLVFERPARPLPGETCTQTLNLPAPRLRRPHP